MFISDTNDLLEARIKLASVDLTSTSVFGFSLVTFDNGTTPDPNGTAFNNDDDTTVDYPSHDALDGMGGTLGVSEGAVTRVFPPINASDPGPYIATGIPDIQLPIQSAGVDWYTLD